MNSINAFVVRSGIRTTRIGAMLIVPLVLTACGSSTPATTPTTLVAPNLANIASAQNLTVSTPATPITFVNSGGDVTTTTGCAADTPLPQGMSIAVTISDGKRTCQITGTPAEAVEPGQTYTITGTNTTGNNKATVTIQVNSLPTIPTVCQQDMDYTNADATGYPVTVTGDSQRLYLRGNHSNGLPHLRFLFRHKGSNTYQMAAVFDDTDAVTGYDATMTEFKIASDDGSSTTQLYVQTANASAATDIDSTTPLTTDGTELDLAKSDGMGVNGNNLVNLIADTAYLFTMTLNPANPTDGIGVGTLTIKKCTDGAAPMVSVDTSPTATTGTTATLTFTSNEDGDAFILVRAMGANIPTVAEVKATDIATQTVTAGSAATVTLTELTISTAYVAYIVVSDGDGNDSEVSATAQFTTAATISAPNLANIDELIILEVGGQSASITFPITGDAPDATDGCAITTDSSPASLPTGLTLATSGNTCAITGTPTDANDAISRSGGPARHFDAISYSVTATNSGSGGSAGTPATVSILIVAAQTTAPTVIKAAQNELRTLIVNGVYADTATDFSSAHIDVPINFSNTGALVTDCRLMPVSSPPESLPEGLTVQPASNLASCIIVGTPTAMATPETYTIVASNSVDGAATGTIRLEVIAAAPDAPMLVAPDAQTYSTNTDITPLIITNKGGRITAGGASNCTVTSATGLPAGLKVKATADGQNCQIFGITPATEGEATVTVTATNSVGAYTTDEFTITVDGTPPVVDPATVRVTDTAATTATLNFTSNEAGTVDIVVLLASDPTTPTSPLIIKRDTITTTPSATNPISADTLVVTEGANAIVLSGLTTDTEYKAHFVVNDKAGNPSTVVSTSAFTPVVPDIIAPVISDPDFSDGTGTTATLNFTSDEAGTAFVLVREVGDTPLTPPTVAEVKATLIPTQTVTADTAATVTLTGLTFDTTYVAYIVVSDGVGNDSLVNAMGTFTTPALMVPNLANIDELIILEVKQTATITFDNTGDPIGDGASDCRITGGTLPGNLTLARTTDGRSCAITGTPAMGSATERTNSIAGHFDALTYTVIATNTAGSSTPATVSILIVPEQTTAPVVPDSKQAQNELRTLVVGQTYVDTANDLSSAHIDVPVTRTTGNASLAINCESEPPLPAGLTVQPASNQYSCIIVGTPTAAVEPKTYTITVSNSQTGVGTGTIRLEVIAAAPPLAAPVLTAPSAQTYPINVEITPLVVDNTGGRITAGGNTNCTARALPAGLKVKATADGQDCQIFGTPTTATVASVTVIATNDAGSADSAAFFITVDATASVIR